MTAYALKASESDHRVKPDGGYVHVSTFRLGIGWWAYRRGMLSIRAVRVLLALHELGIRRAAHGWSEKKLGRSPEFTPHFSVDELGRLCGLPAKKARVALKELLDLGLVREFSGERITFAPSLEDLELSPDQRSEFWEWFSGLTKRKRVPLPRRILALACESSSPAQIGFILGASLRCIYFHPKGEGFNYTGWLSSSWLADRFGVCLRAAKAAKAHLVRLGWVKLRGRVGKFGERLTLNPAWERVDQTKEAGEPGPNSAPLDAASGPNSAPPKTRESFSETEIQKPRESPRPVVGDSGPGLFQTELDSKSKDSEGSSSVRLSSIKPEDFKDLNRALELFRQAVKCGLMPDESEHSRLRWVAAIERARTVPAQNPAGLFLSIVKNRRWGFLSEGHWDAANTRLKAHLFGSAASMPLAMGPLGGLGTRLGTRASQPRPPQPMLGKDALLIRTLRGFLAQRGMRVKDILPHLRQQDASWNRERLEAAELELLTPHFGVELCSPSSQPASFGH